MRVRIGTFILVVMLSSATNLELRAQTLGSPTARGPRSQARSDGVEIGVEEVAARAAATSSDVRALGHAVESARARRGRVVTELFPRLLLGASYRRLSPINPPPAFSGLAVDPALPDGPLPPGTQLFKTAADPFPVFLDHYALRLELTVPFSDYLLRFPQRLGSAAHAISAAELGVSIARSNASTRARRVYYEYLRFAARREVAERSVLEAALHVREAQALRDEGRLSGVDLMQLEARLAERQLAVEGARAGVELSQEHLRIITHDTARRTYRREDAVSGSGVEVPGEDDLSRLWAEASRRRAEERALDHDRRAAALQADAEAGSRWPRVEGFAELLYASPNTRYFPQVSDARATWMLGVQLTFSPNASADSAFAAAELRATSARLGAEQTSIKEAIRLEVLEAHLAVREAKLALETRRRVLGAAEEEYRVQHERFKSGMLRASELAEAEFELFAARNDSVDGFIQLRAAREFLRHAIGAGAVQ